MANIIHSVFINFMGVLITPLIFLYIISAIIVIEYIKNRHNKNTKNSGDLFTIRLVMYLVLFGGIIKLHSYEFDVLQKHNIQGNIKYVYLNSCTSFGYIPIKHT